MRFRLARWIAFRPQRAWDHEAGVLRIEAKSPGTTDSNGQIALILQNAGMMTLLIATRNRHKVEEIQAILGDGYRFMTLNEFPDAPEVEEDKDTFAGNSSKKAEELAAWLSGRPDRPEGMVLVIADDSGLEVDVLDGAPGVFSARYAAMESGSAGNSPDSENNARLLRELADVSDDKKTARFRCVIAVLKVGAGPGRSATFDGACEGRIQDGPTGDAGFGYDPLFVPEGFEQSFAELGEETKNRLSHRARALEKLKPWLEAR